jgi:hypothetical protein
VFDPNYGYLAVDADVFKRLDKKFLHPRYFFETSLLVELNIIGAVAEEVPMPAIYAGEPSSLSVIQVITTFPGLLLSRFFRRIWLQYFVLNFSVGTIFMTLGSLMTLFGVIWGAVWWRRSSSRHSSNGGKRSWWLPSIDPWFQNAHSSINFGCSIHTKNITSCLQTGGNLSRRR